MNKKSKRSQTPPAGAQLCADATEVLRQLFLRMRPPEEARRHFQTARLEVLKGLRAVLDARIEQRSRARAKGEPIEVE